MTKSKSALESETLDAMLRGQSSPQTADVTNAEIALVGALKATAKDIHADPQFQAQLENRLIQLHKNRRPRTDQLIFSTLRTAAWVGLAALLVLALGWSIRNLLPQPVTLATLPVIQGGSTTATPINSPTSPPTPIYLPSSTASPATFTIPMIPDFKLQMLASFPESPSEVSVYVQQPEEELTVESAQATAARIGVSGGVYKATNESPEITIYIVTDGRSRVFISSTQRFYYVADYTQETIRKKEYPPVDEQIKQAEDFLKSHGLLDFPYREETEADLPGLVRFVQVLDDHPVVYGTEAPRIDVQIDSQGQVTSIDYNRPAFRELGRYPIITAQEAWQKILSSNAPIGVEQSESRHQINDMQSWQREYPQEQRVQLYGYFEVLQPAQSGLLPFITFKNYQIEGHLQELFQLAVPSHFMQIWGQFVKGSQGQQIFRIEGWQSSPFADQSLQGKIQRQGDQVFLLTGDQKLLLPDPPADLPDGEQANVGGIVLDQPEPTLEWSWINTGSGGGGGGGGGGTGFAELNLEGLPSIPGTPTLTPVPIPTFQPGQRVDGVRGTPFILIHQYTDGTTWMEINLFLEPSEAVPGGNSVRLVGQSLTGIEAYYQIPIRVWGTFSDTSGSMPVLSVERYEPVYPGLKPLAWLGTYKSITLEGQQALLFTTQKGKQYILGSSVNTGQVFSSGAPGDPVIIEGYQFPDKTFGGYPVINEYAESSSQGLNDLSSYQLHNNTPPVIQESTTQGMQNKGKIEKIELAYYTIDLRYNPPGSFTYPVYVQPVWHFTGHYENGTIFEFFVQALSPKYLK
jgi:hypothetical protein